MGSPVNGFDHDAWQREVILRNSQEDPHYAPYCMRCTGLVRMRVVARHYWRCHCGAQCDYRLEPTGSADPVNTPE